MVAVATMVATMVVAVGDKVTGQWKPRRRGKERRGKGFGEAEWV